MNCHSMIPSLASIKREMNHLEPCMVLLTTNGRSVLPSFLPSRCAMTMYVCVDTVAFAEKAETSRLGTS